MFLRPVVEVQVDVEVEMQLAGYVPSITREAQIVYAQRNLSNEEPKRGMPIGFLTVLLISIAVDDGECIYVTEVE